MNPKREKVPSASSKREKTLQPKRESTNQRSVLRRYRPRFLAFAAGLALLFFLLWDFEEEVVLEVFGFVAVLGENSSTICSRISLERAVAVSTALISMARRP